MHKTSTSYQSAPSEGYAQVNDVQLYYREIGMGQPIIIIHGGPDFDHNYLLPDMDRLSSYFRLIYYDQRGRGRSGVNLQPEQVTIDSEIEDLEGLRAYFHQDTIAVLGHSFGGLLAMEYAIRHPHRISHLILMNTAPASHEDLMFFRQERRRKTPNDLDEMNAISATAKYQEGDIETEAAYYRIHFRSAIRRPEHLDSVIKSLRVGMTPDGILKARAIENRLYEQTWLKSEYNLLHSLNRLTIPTLVIHGDYDFVPMTCTAHIAQAIPGARLVLLEECGHFSYLERPDRIGEEISSFMTSTKNKPYR
jgi:proline iminopeptidase